MIAVALLSDVCAKSFRGVGEILFVDDVVSVEDASRAVAADFHGYGFWYSCADEVAYAGASEVVEEFAVASLVVDESCDCAGVVPAAGEGVDALAEVGEYPGAFVVALLVEDS